MANSFPAPTTNLESLKEYVKCPICYEVPRDGVMLLCLNGHNVCATCKKRLGGANFSKCPQCRGDFYNPPAMNWTVAGLVNSIPFEFPCKFATAKDAEHTGCEVKGTDAVLARHEIVCEHRSVACVACGRFVSASRFLDHMATAHSRPARKSVPRSDEIKMWFAFRRDGDSGADDVGAIGTPHEVSAGFVLPCLGFQGDLVYVWLTMVGRGGVGGATERLGCRIRLGNADHSTTAVAPVYSVDRDWRDIPNDDDCARFSRWSVLKMLTDDVTEDERKSGYVTKFEASFKLFEKAA
jgi:hypothetical protein